MMAKKLNMAVVSFGESKLGAKIIRTTHVSDHRTLREHHQGTRSQVPDV